MDAGRGQKGIVTVFGGSGFVGRHVVRALARDGWRVRAAVRRPDLAGHLQPMGAVGQIHAVQANLRYPESVARAVAGVDAVVNLVAILAPSGRQTFEAVHVDGARAVARATRQAGIGRLVHVSAIGADPKAASHYARTKGKGEEAIREEFPDAVILRPSIIFGPEDAFFNRFAGLAQLSPIMPLIGGQTRFQPVFAGDVADAISAVLAGKAQSGAVYEIGGPEVLTFRELLDRTQAWAGHRRPYLPVPFWLAKLQAIATSPLPNSLRPVTLDQVRMLERDNVVSQAAKDEHRTIEALGVAKAKNAAMIVPTYLERYKPRGQFAHYKN